MKKLVLLSLLLAAGCVGPQSRVAGHRALCQENGLREGTPEFADCLVKLEAAHHQPPANVHR